MFKLKLTYRRLTATLWFVPTLLALCGVFLGLLLVGVDRYIGYGMGFYPKLFGVESSGSRDMLAVIAGSMITVAGTVFSITIVALTLASTQFSPRILRNFIRDTGNQVVLGVFVGIFAYCIVVLRTIRDGGGDEGGDFVPSVAVIFGVLLGLVAIGFLIYHIHHVATEIQASNIVSRIAVETIAVIKEIYPNSSSDNEFDLAIIESQLKNLLWQTIKVRENGYIQNVDLDELLMLSEKNNVVIRFEQGIGEFAITGEPLISISTANPNLELNGKLENRILEAFSIGNYRTIEQDAAFGVRQIVDIALKALSPAVNDTTTGVICIDYLTAILSCFVTCSSGSKHLFSKGKLRLILKPQRFEDLFDLAFNQIRQNAHGNVAIILRQIAALEFLFEKVVSSPLNNERGERIELIRDQFKRLAELAASVAQEDDRRAVLRRVEKARALLHQQ